ncbi:MAG: LysM domain-containing protein [Desulfuromonadaceae bacterium]|nr:LysM domain-containing protein [Desulfuromonadaceae bacterium]MDD2850190.1 LysM domain-containing protein [Desulfuromonadaceae bacterium]MDD4128908.1 LysM domain-containing protein [Desulfuromonadaceae bacterium]
MRLVKIAACVLAVIALVPVTGGAAQNEFDLDLRELRHGWVAPPQHNQQSPAPASLEIDLKELRKIAPPLTAKPTRNPHNTAPAAGTDTAAAHGSGQESIHVVLPGEHLFIILMKYYGLSNQAAELLIPEVMRLNGVTSPKALKIGQRLRIPLPYKNGKMAATPLVTERETNLPAPAAVDIPVSTVATEVLNSPAAAEPASSPSPIPAPDSITVTPAPPCVLAHDLLEKLGLLEPSTISIHGKETVSAASADRGIIVVCGISEAERYTYERLLNRNDKRFISLDEDEPAYCVVEKMASQLGLVFSKRGNESESSSTSYYFEPFAAWTHGIQLTIEPVSRDTDRTANDNPDSSKE